MGASPAAVPVKVCSGAPVDPSEKVQFSWQIEDRSTTQSKNAGRLIPIPVLTVDELEPTNECRFADFETVIQIKKQFALGDHSQVRAR